MFSLLGNTVIQLFSSADLEHLFNRQLGPAYATVLRGGAAEPFYQAGRAGQAHTIWYTRDYFRSALHEIAHWCVAGPARREQDDYGYWYAPDGRTPTQQAQFEQVEVAPQALELLACAATGHRFRVSLDNLNGAGGVDETRFAAAVGQAAEARLRQRHGQRWDQWLQLLEQHYRSGVPLDAAAVTAVQQLPAYG